MIATPRRAPHLAQPGSTSPPIELEALPVARGRLHVVRDDRLEGGTKQRAAEPFLAELVVDGVREVVYASPFAGFAQVALAASCRRVGLRCTVFASRDPAAPGAT